jgi:hypothetical protein
MEWPQITYIVLLAATGGLVLAKQGEPREPYNFWMWLLSCAIVLPLLYFGGFFK